MVPKSNKQEKSNFTQKSVQIEHGRANRKQIGAREATLTSPGSARASVLAQWSKLLCEGSELAPILGPWDPPAPPRPSCVSLHSGAGCAPAAAPHTAAHCRPRWLGPTPAPTPERTCATHDWSPLMPGPASPLARSSHNQGVRRCAIALGVRPPLADPGKQSRADRAGAPPRRGTQPSSISGATQTRLRRSPCAASSTADPASS